MIRSLVSDYPHHGFVISRDEAETLGLPVHPMEEYEHETAARRLSMRGALPIKLLAAERLRGDRA